MKRNILFDARMWSHPGIGRYIRELAVSLSAIDRDRSLGFLIHPDAKANAEKTLSVSGRPRFIEARSGIYSLAEQLEIPRLARGADLLHVPHFNIPLFYSGRLVTTVHDLIYLHEPASSAKPALAKLYAKTLLKAVARKSSAVIAVSEYTKKDLLEHFPALEPSKVSVVYEGASGIFRDGAPAVDARQARDKFGFQDPFVLFVGTQKPHKNVPTLIRALAEARQKGVRHELILVGKKDASAGELSELIKAHPFVREAGPVTDADLASLYRAADLLVLPSFREGFGLPVLEAMACGTPVAISDRASLPEVAGEAGLRFDPTRIDALSELLYNVLQNPELRRKMSSSGLEQAKNFSWEKAAERTWQVYEQALA